MADFDIATVIEEFLADSSRNSLELPHMTTGQRKQARKIAEEHTELKCESYGFGQERQLHLFKKRQSPQPSPNRRNSLCSTPAFCIKNTFIDDWSGEEPEPIIFRSMPAPLNKQLLEALAADHCSKSEDSPASFDDVSTTASQGKAPSTDGSSPLGPVDWLLPELGEELQVRNTFIHIEEASADDRAVQSMPHGMFGKFFAQEQSAQEEEEPSYASGFLLEPLLDTDAGFQPPAEMEEKPKRAGLLLAPLLHFDGPPPLLQNSGFLLAPLESQPLPVLPPPSSPPNTPPPACSSIPSTPPPPYEALLSVPVQPSMAGVLPAGAKVILQGLIAAAAFNGCQAVVESWDAEAGRYAVSVEAGTGAAQQAKVKPENLRSIAR